MPSPVHREGLWRLERNFTSQSCTRTLLFPRSVRGAHVWPWYSPGGPRTPLCRGTKVGATGTNLLSSERGHVSGHFGDIIGHVGCFSSILQFARDLTSNFGTVVPSRIIDSRFGSAGTVCN